jgi:hypothetical protein
LHFRRGNRAVAIPIQRGNDGRNRSSGRPWIVRLLLIFRGAGWRHAKFFESDFAVVVSIKFAKNLSRCVDFIIGEHAIAIRIQCCEKRRGWRRAPVIAIRIPGVGSGAHQQGEQASNWAGFHDVEKLR